MAELIGLLLFMIILSLIPKLLKNKLRGKKFSGFKKKKSQYSQASFPEPEQQKDTNAELDYTGKYQKRFLLSINEKDQFIILKFVTDQLGLHLFAKVRLLDVLEPRQGIKNYQTYFWKVQAKHIDFLICNANFTTLCAIEIDDSSHDAPDRQARDNFIDTILTDCRIPIIRKRYIKREEMTEELTTLMQKNK